MIRTKSKVGRNDPCPCGSGLKSKRCHQDPKKLDMCNQVANKKMVELIREEQYKQIAIMQQAECEKCNKTGKVLGAKCRCQFVTENEYIKYQYDLRKGEQK